MIDNYLKRWRKPGYAGFRNFLNDVKPVVLGEKSQYVPIDLPKGEIAKELKQALSGKHSTVILSWPRRHGKSVLVAAIIFWKFMSRQNQEIALVSNSQRQTASTCFKILADMIKRTPYTSELVRSGELDVQTYAISYPALGNKVTAQPANPASLYGKKLNIAQISELHAANNDETFQALAGATIDVRDSLILIDSTVGPKTSPLYDLYNLDQTGSDPTLFYSHIEYQNLDEAKAKSPKWIPGQRLESRAKTMLPVDFAVQHLNKWSDAASDVFSEEVLKRCIHTYPLNVSDLVGTRNYSIGAGLDRAQAFKIKGDATVSACIVKVLGDDGEPHFYVLDCSAVKFATDGAIKRRMKSYQRDHSLTRVSVESYQAQSVHHALLADGIDAELVAPHRGQQQMQFTELARAAQESRLHIHPKFTKLLSEMGTFQHTVQSGHGTTQVVFEHAKGCHDDHCYALGLAVYSLREVELNPYELPGIECNAISAVARHCLLNGGDLVPNCADSCLSMVQTHDLYRDYFKRAAPNPLRFEDFYEAYVVNKGAHSVRR